MFFFFSSRRRHTRYWRDWSSDVCSSDLGVVGQVNVGLATPALSNVPAVAVHENVTGTVPAEPVADSEIGVPTAVSSGAALIESRLAQICVVPLTTIVPWPAGAVEQLSVKLTGVVVPAPTEKLFVPLQLNEPSTDVAVSEIEYPVPAGIAPLWNEIVLLNRTLTVPVLENPVPGLLIVKATLLIVTPGAICSSIDRVPVGPSSA